MTQLLHELTLWASFMIICGVSIYLNPPAGLAVSGAGAIWIALVLRRGRS